MSFISNAHTFTTTEQRQRGKNEHGTDEQKKKYEGESDGKKYEHPLIINLQNE